MGFSSFINIPLSQKMALSNTNSINQQEAFWQEIRQQFPVAQEPIINLNSGSGSNQPLSVIKMVQNYYLEANQMPVYKALEKWEAQRSNIKKRLANLAGCSSEELAIVRNTTEALCSIIHGISLKKGSKIIIAEHDYDTVINTWKQKASKENLEITNLNIDLSKATKAEIIETYEKAFCKKTKLVLLTHMTHQLGSILPVAEIAQIAQSKGIEVMVDAAHTFAHLDYKIPDLHCDYWGTSLHKWLCAPYGNGLLYVKKEKIEKINPLFLVTEKLLNNIVKFEATGTRAYHLDMGISAALDFYEQIGIPEKEARLRYLKDYWVNQLKEIPRLTIHTQQSEAFSCGLSTFSIEGVRTGQFRNHLYQNHQIIVKATQTGTQNAIRISPNVYTTTEELDTFVAAVKAFMAE